MKSIFSFVTFLFFVLAQANASFAASVFFPSVPEAQEQPLKIKDFSATFFNENGTPKHIFRYEDQKVVSRYDFNYRPDGMLFRIDRRLSSDINSPVMSATYFKGVKGAEKPAYAVDFDVQGSILSVNMFKYDEATGALSRIDQKEDFFLNVPLVSSLFLTGNNGEEQLHYALIYDKGGNVHARQDYSYASGGVLAKIDMRNTGNSASPVSGTVYYDGKAGEELPLLAVTFDQAGNVASAKDFGFTAKKFVQPVSYPAAGKAVFSNSGSNPINMIGGLETLPLPELNSKLMRNQFVHDLQGVLMSIDVRAGPVRAANLFEKGAMLS